MSKTETNKPSATAKANGKKHYEKPSILSVEPLEAMAVVCSGPTAKANPISCNIGPISS
ncbi:hypothetical protein [Thiolapillus sp.]